MENKIQNNKTKDRWAALLFWCVVALQHHGRLLYYINLLCLLRNITKGYSTLLTLPHHRLLCSACSTHHRGLLCHIVEGCSTLSTLPALP